MKGIAGTLGVVLGVAVVVVVLSSMYTVDMREQVIITQFGQPVGDPIAAPGLHFKLPFVQKVNRFDKRWLDWDGEVDKMRTAEKTPILVDTYARWRIKDPLTFFLRLRNETTAQTRLDDIIESETRNVLAANRLIEVVRSTERELPESADARAPGAPVEVKEVPLTDAEVLAQIKFGRHVLTRNILEKVSEAVPDFGIEVVDLQFQRVNYTPAVEKKAFERMISERKRIAARYRSEGQGESAKIRGKREKDLAVIESEAYKAVQEIEGGADATATAIYANAYSLDPEFYRLLKSLESYKTTIDAETVIVLSTDSDFYRALKTQR